MGPLGSLGICKYLFRIDLLPHGVSQLCTPTVYPHCVPPLCTPTVYPPTVYPPLCVAQTVSHYHTSQA